MPSPSSREYQSQSSRGFDWPGIVKILVAQILVLLALSGALIFYLNWSSEAVQAEFMGTSQLQLPRPQRHTQFSTPVQTVTAPMACYRRA